MPDPDYEVAIVGAGASGTYAAWRLAGAGKKSIAVFEMSQRVGGRLYSKEMPGLAGVRRAELGGMRYLTSQAIVTSLVSYLQDTLPAPLKERFTSVNFEVDSKNNIFYLRNVHMQLTELTNPAILPYSLGYNEQGQTPNGLLAWAINNVVPNASYLSNEEWRLVQRRFTVDGDSLYDLGFWNLLQRVLTQEGYAYVYDGQGYNTIVHNWNAADAMPWTVADFSPGVKYSSIQGGFQALPETLLQEATKRGVDYLPGHRLVSWEARKGGQGGVVLTFHYDNGDSRKITAGKLILAMPRRALDLISMPADLKVSALLSSVTPMPLFKLFLGYRYPWWRVLGLKYGRSLTDVPLRQVYYWGSNYDHFFPHVPPETGGEPNAPEHSLMMASYSDGRDNNFWGPLTEPIADTLRQDLHGLADLAGVDDARVARIVDVAQDQLRTVHGVSYVPQPYTWAYADWSRDPYGGGWNSWNVGVKSWDVTDEVRHPYDDVYICGEAYSLKQGWVEGALETAEKMLREDFKLRRPKWLQETAAAT